MRGPRVKTWLQLPCSWIRYQLNLLSCWWYHWVTPINIWQKIVNGIKGLQSLLAQEWNAIYSLSGIRLSSHVEFTCLFSHLRSISVISSTNNFIFVTTSEKYCLNVTEIHHLRDFICDCYIDDGNLFWCKIQIILSIWKCH